MMQAVIAGQSPDMMPQLEQLQSQVAELHVKQGDLEVRRDQIARQRGEAKTAADRAISDKQWADVQHEINVVQGQLSVVTAKMAELQHARDMMQAKEAQMVLTVPPPTPQDPFDKAQLLGMETAGFVLLLPIVYALTRRILRGGRRAPAIDFESSPRLQRMEQAIESIAIEVERIGEAQRFTTKLLSERQPEAVATHIPPIQTARREPGTITPH
jgi:outer membrane murein-binding lipoprotein Lpp